MFFTCAPLLYPLFICPSCITNIYIHLYTTCRHTSHVDDREWDRKHPRRNERDLSLDLADRHSNGSSPTTSLHSEPAGRRGGPEHRRSEFRSDRSQRHERGYRDGHERGSRDRHDDSRSGSRSRVSITSYNIL